MFTKEISVWEAMSEWVNVPVLFGCAVVGGVWVWMAVRRVWWKRALVEEASEGRVGGLGYDSELYKSSLFVVGGSKKGLKNPRLFHLPFTGVSTDVQYQAASGRIEMAKFGTGIQARPGLGFVVGGLTGRDTPLDSVLKICTDQKSSGQSIHMDFLKSLPKPRWGASGAFSQGILLVAGGVEGGSAGLPTRSGIILNGKNWTRTTKMEHARLHAGSAAFGERAVMIGGEDKSGITLRTVEEYNYSLDKWVVFQKQMPYPRQGLAVLVFNGRVMVVGGGVAGGDVTRGALAYDPLTGNWDHLSPMNYARSHAGIWEDGGSVWVWGGESEGVIERYESRMDKWVIEKDQLMENFEGGVILKT